LLRQLARRPLVQDHVQDHVHASGAWWTWLTRQPLGALVGPLLASSPCFIPRTSPCFGVDSKDPHPNQFVHQGRTEMVPKNPEGSSDVAYRRRLACTNNENSAAIAWKFHALVCSLQVGSSFAASHFAQESCPASGGPYLNAGLFGGLRGNRAEDVCCDANPKIFRGLPR